MRVEQKLNIDFSIERVVHERMLEYKKLMPYVLSYIFINLLAIFAIYCIYTGTSMYSVVQMQRRSVRYGCDST